MEFHGFLRGPVEIKKLIIYVLAQLPLPCEREVLSEYVMGVAAVDYFSFTVYLAELVDTENVRIVPEDKYELTGKGKEVYELSKTDLPPAMRNALKAPLRKVADEMLRQTLITTDMHRESKGLYVQLGYTDGIGPIMSMKLLCPNEEYAAKAIAKYREEAENIYLEIIHRLCE